MTGLQALTLIFKEANFSFVGDDHSRQQLNIDDHLIYFHAYDRAIYIYCPICKLAANKDNSLLLEHFCNLTAAVYLDHVVANALQDNIIKLELVLDESCFDDVKLMLSKLETFLNDCDFFKAQLDGYLEHDS